MLTTIASCNSRIVKVEGPACSGKTEALVRRAAELLKAGIDPEQVFVAVATGFAADAFRARLTCALPADLAMAAQRVAVGRPLDACCAVLGQERARELTGRVPRILNDAEQVFFLEDLKTLGQKPARLRNMLMFFCAQWSKFEDEAEWVLPGEEEGVLAHARMVLGSTGAMLRHEAPYLCGKLLASEKGRFLAGRYACVLADDYQNYSHAEQVCLGLCARDQFVVAGDASRVTRVNTDYPHPRGFENFERLRRNVEVFELRGSFGIEGALGVEKALRARIRDAAPAQLPNPGERPAAGDRGRICAAACGETSCGDTLFLLWQTPEAELAGVARAVRAYLAADPSRCASDVTVAVPTARWGSLVRCALAAEGIAASTAGLGPRLGGDPRGAGYHDALTSYVALCLAADPHDMVAWRAWTGFDNAITNSESWSIMYRRAADAGLPLYDVLASVAADPQEKDPALKAAVLHRSWNAGQRVIESCRDLCGRELAGALGMVGQPVFGEVVDAVGADEGAVALRDRVRRYLSEPTWPEGPGLVRIALCENLCGVHVPCLIMPGMVNGMLPSRDVFEIDKTDDARRRTLDEGRAHLRCCLAAGTDCLVVSTFAQAGLELAEKSRMRVERIASVGGQRVCVVSPSLYFDEAVGAFSGFADGEAVDFRQVFSAASA